MLTLPNSQRRLSLLSFLITLGFLGTAALAVTGFLLGGAWAAGIGVGVMLAAGVLATELLSPNSTWGLYHGWNSVAAAVGHVIHVWVVWLVYHMVIRAVGPGRIETASHWDRAVGSMWRNRSAESADTGIEPKDIGSNSQQTHVQQPQSFIRWSVGSGNGWMIFLCPFLFLLRHTSPPIKEEVPQDVYTLY